MPSNGPWPNPNNKTGGKASVALVKMELYLDLDFEACVFKTLRLVLETVRIMHSTKIS